ncbi:hypothetical protein EB796_005040 [Bugula neritina]|uniref:Endonuclease/exonuclease/phosphatase domain-containing protein n=1 Tax=Bugula neritina TaxID=10212 RepID=A0A7J7KEC6_BUGNE|nr:hypothetical protein EB796_005040 [Bugula neritina]
MMNDNNAVLESIKSKSEQIAQAAEKSEKIDALREKDFRDHNIIIFGIKESKEKDSLLTEVNSLLKDCSSSQIATSSNCYRLGKKDPSKKDQMRPHIRQQQIELNLELGPLEVIRIQVIEKDVKSWILCCCYVPPSSASMCVVSIENLLNHLSLTYPNNYIVLTGDFNLPDINWTNVRVKESSSRKSLHFSFLNNLKANGFHQLVTEPTHIAGNTLDLVITNNCNIVDNINIINPGISDHYMVSFRLSFLKAKPDYILRTKKLYHKADTISIRNYLSEVFEKVERAIAFGASIDCVWNIFELGLKKAVELFVPVCTSRPKRINEPPCSIYMLEKQSKSREAYKKYKTTSLENDHIIYKSMRRQNRKMFRSVESKYYDDFLFKPMVNGKQKPFFRHMKNISGKQAKSPFLSIINELYMTIGKVGKVIRLMALSFCYAPVTSNIGAFRTDDGKIMLKGLLKDSLAYDDSPCVVAWDTHRNKAAGFILNHTFHVDQALEKCRPPIPYSNYSWDKQWLQPIQDLEHYKH